MVVFHSRKELILNWKTIYLFIHISIYVYNVCKHTMCKRELEIVQFKNSTIKDVFGNRIDIFWHSNRVDVLNKYTRFRQQMFRNDKPDGFFLRNTKQN